jgi:hypothetical protein
MADSPLVKIIRRRIDTAPIDAYSIPNCDVRLLVLEIERLTEEVFAWMAIANKGDESRRNQQSC